VSFNGGRGGIVARPTAEETAAVNQRHVPETEAQVQHVQHSRSVPGLHATENKGKPSVLATTRPETSRPQESAPRGGETARLPPSDAREPERSRETPRPRSQPIPQAERPPGNPNGAHAEDERSNEHARPEERGGPHEPARPEQHARPEEDARPEQHAHPEQHAPREQRNDAPGPSRPENRPQTTPQPGNERAPKAHEPEGHAKEPEDN
jgi:hypothetical protein